MTFNICVIVTLNATYLRLAQLKGQEVDISLSVYVCHFRS